MSRTFGLLACACLAFLYVPADARATDYFVSAQSGDDANDGLTEGTPWKTTARVQTEAGAGRFLPSDRILFKRGDIWSEVTTGVTPQMEIGAVTSGSDAGHITFGAYGSGEAPKFDFGPVAAREAGNIYTLFGWRFSGSDYIRLENLEFTGGFNIYEFVGDAHVVDFVGKTDNVVVADVRFSDTAIGAALSIKGASRADSSDNVVIQRVSLVNAFAEKYRRDGIYVQNTTHFTVEDCVVERAGTVGMGFGAAQYGLVRRNSIRDGLAWAVVGAGISRYITFEWNSIVGNGNDAFTRPPFQFAGEGLCDADTFNPMAMDLAAAFNWTIRYNVVGRQHKPCRNRWETNFVYLEGSCANMMIYGNVVYRMDGPCFISGNSVDNYFVNNLCYDNDQAYADPNKEWSDIRLAGGFCENVQLDETTTLCTPGWGATCPCPEIVNVGGQFGFYLHSVFYSVSLLQGKVRPNTTVANNIFVNRSIPESSTEMAIATIGLIGGHSDKTTRAVFSNNLSWAPPGKMYQFGRYSGSTFTRMTFGEWNGWSRTDPDTGATVTVTNELNLDPLIPFDDGDGVDQGDFVPPKGSPVYDQADGTYTDIVVGAGDMALLLDAAEIEFDEGNGVLARALANNWDFTHASPDLGPFVGTNDPAPVITNEPVLALAETYPLSTDPANPTETSGIDYFLWTYHDDWTACTEGCTHSFQYRLRGTESWMSGTPGNWGMWVWIERPGDFLGVGSFEFRVRVADCAGNVTKSLVYYVDVVPADRDGDGVPDLTDCAPGDASAFASPGEVSGVAFLADRATFAWDSQAASAGPGVAYDVLRGDVGGFPVGSPSAETCHEPQSADAQAEDPAEPAPGAGFFYLVRGVNACGVGTYGLGSSLAERVSPACP